MTKAELVEALSIFPDEAEVVTADLLEVTSVTGYVGPRGEQMVIIADPEEEEDLVACIHERVINDRCVKCGHKFPLR